MYPLTSPGHAITVWLEFWPESMENPMLGPRLQVDAMAHAGATVANSTSTNPRCLFTVVLLWGRAAAVARIPALSAPFDRGWRGLDGIRTGAHGSRLDSRGAWPPRRPPRIVPPEAKP